MEVSSDEYSNGMAIVLCLVFSGRCQAQVQASAQPMKHLLVLGEEKGYRHESVSHAMATIERLGRESGLWTTTIRTDTEVLTKQKLEYNAKNLNDFDAVLFYTGGELEMNLGTEGRVFILRSRRWQGLYRRAQRDHHVHLLARIRRNDRRIFRRASLGHL